MPAMGAPDEEKRIMSAAAALLASEGEVGSETTRCALLATGSHNPKSRLRRCFSFRLFARRPEPAAAWSLNDENVTGGHFHGEGRAEFLARAIDPLDPVAPDGTRHS